jgi:hypothetical protein
VGLQEKVEAFHASHARIPQLADLMVIILLTPVILVTDLRGL